MAKNAEDRIKAGSDWVKVYGSRGSFDSVDTTQTLTFDEMKAIVDAAHALGHKVAIHSYGPSGVKDAVRAGADSVEHGIDLDDETLAEMAQARHRLGADDRSQPLLRGREGRVRLQAGGDRRRCRTTSRRTSSRRGARSRPA